MNEQISEYGLTFEQDLLSGALDNQPIATEEDIAFLEQGLIPR